MLKFGRKNKYFIFGLLVLGWVIFINFFPKGYVFGGGDTNQMIEAMDSFRIFFWDAQGRTGLFYFIFYLLDLLNISNSLQLSFYLGFIIFGSYFSFWLFSNLIFSEARDLSRSLVSLFYALNLYTLFLFTGNTGFSYYPSLYVFIPILIGLYLKFLDYQKIIYGFGFCLVLFLGSSGFGNPAFALSFTIFLFLLTLIFLFTKKIIPTKKFIGKIILITILSFLVSASWIFPITPQMKGGVEDLSSTNVINFETIIRSSANPISYTIGLMQNSENNFPFNFYYKNLKSFREFFIFLAFIPIILVFWGFYYIRNTGSRILFFSIFGLFLLFVMLVTKVRPPFEVSNYFIYHIWGFNTLRGYDKIAIYIPFLISFLLLATLISVKTKKWLYVLIFISLLTPLPFYIGKLQQTAGYRVNSEKDYRKVSMSFLVKIPKEYYAIREKLNSDAKRSKIATLPSTYGDGSGVSYYPKWKFYGIDITRNLYNKNLLDANASQYNFPTWNYAGDFSDNSADDNAWIIKTLGMMNSQYIIFHKDAPEDSVQKTLPKMKDLESKGFIKNLEENDYFILYEISPDYFLPYLSWQNGNPEIQGNITSIERNFAKVKTDSSSADFQEINPKKFVINLPNQNITDNLVLAETYNPLWKAYYKLGNGKEIEIKDHFKIRGYANGWKINPPENTKQIIVEYYPVRLMWRGIWISGITILSLLIYLLIYYYNKFRKNKSSLII